MKRQRPTKAKRAATPDDLIRTSAEGRIRMIAKKKRLRRRTKPAEAPLS